MKIKRGDKNDLMKLKHMIPEQLHESMLSCEFFNVIKDDKEVFGFCMINESKFFVGIEINHRSKGLAYKLSEETIKEYFNKKDTPLICSCLLNRLSNELIKKLGFTLVLEDEFENHYTLYKNA